MDDTIPPASKSRSAESISYWMHAARHLKPATTPLLHDIHVSTCIIGAGIAGLTTAYYLAKQGESVVVLDAGDICCGETGRTTGYLTWVIDDGLTNIIRYFGVEGAKLHVDSHRQAVSMIERIVSTENIDCEFKRVPSYWISRKVKEEQDASPDSEITKEHTMMLQAGMDTSAIRDRAPFVKDSGPCIMIPDQGQFRAADYCYGLYHAIIKSGGQVYSNSRVSEWKEGKNEGETYVKTDSGCIVNCRNIVMATNVPLQLVTTIAKLEANRTYVVAGEVPKGKYDWCIYQDDSMCTEQKPYVYGRFTSLNDTSDLLLVGGEDNLVGIQDDSYQHKFDKLQAWARERYPDINFTYHWSGQVQEPVDKIAYIGRDPGSQNVFIITGDSGMGLTHATIGGKLVSDLILGNPNPWEQLYDPSRLKMKSIPKLVEHLCEVNMQYKDYFKGGDVQDIENLVDGEGAIICKGIHRYAVYKDDQGALHACAATCPHLKGQVRWNALEKSWDCPVHGSRFDKFGNVINGPAKSNLKPIPIDTIKN